MKKKLALKVDDLRVDTFTAAEQQPGGRGTVAGHYGTNHTQQASCPGSATCDYTCDGYATSPGPEYHCILCGGGGGWR